MNLRVDRLLSFPSLSSPQPILAGVDLERLERVESQLALLWEQVQQGNEKQEQRHTDIFGLYSTLREKLSTETNRESLGLWVNSLLEQRLGVLQSELKQEKTHRTQVDKLLLLEISVF